MLITRRRFLAASGAYGVTGGKVGVAPYYSRANRRPRFTHGVQSGDVDTSSGMIWTRTDRPARIDVDISYTESFARARRLPPLDIAAESDCTIKRLVTDLAADQDVFYRITATDLGDTNAVSHPIQGRFRTAPLSRRDVRFAWSGDTAGQGWGIDAVGMRTYATIMRHAPDFFLHSGDTVYADGPMTDRVTLADGGEWRNVVVTDGKRKVAETLDEYREQWKYNLLDQHLLDLNQTCPTFFQWDDHDVMNNWSSSKDLSDDSRYTEKSIARLAARASRAFHEMTPTRLEPSEPSRVYRKIAYGPLLDVFFLDMRSYRGPNGANLDTTLTETSVILGRQQVRWLKRALAGSTATWKIIAADMPLSLVVWDDATARSGFEAVSNHDDGLPKGRELEIADLLRFIKSAPVHNIVWLTADVHYTAAHHYHPDRARFQDFAPFWEFVSGPIHAGTFGPNDLDLTFGPELRFIKAPTPEQGQNLPPSMGLQFFGLVDVSGRTGQMTVRLMDRDDHELYRVVLDPQGS